MFGHQTQLFIFTWQTYNVSTVYINLHIWNLGLQVSRVKITQSELKSALIRDDSNHGRSLEIHIARRAAASRAI